MEITLGAPFQNISKTRNPPKAFKFLWNDIRFSSGIPNCSAKMIDILRDRSRRLSSGNKFQNMNLLIYTTEYVCQQKFKQGRKPGSQLLKYDIEDDPSVQ